MPPATLLNQADPHLAALKSLALALMKRGRDTGLEAELTAAGTYDMGNKRDMSRGKLYQAIRDGDRSGALAWLNAVELAVESAVAVIPNTETSAVEAVKGIRRLLETPRRLHG